MISLLPLPPARADQLAGWSERALTGWSRLEERASVLAAHAGTGRRFDELVQEARGLLDALDRDLPHRMTAEPRFARAVVTAWAGDRDLCERTMTSELVEMLRPVEGRRPSRLAVITTTSLLLAHFDALDEWRPGLFATLAATIRAMVAASAVGRADSVETLRTQGAFLLDPQGPRTLARHLLATGVDPVDWLRAHHLGTMRNLRYAHLLRDAVYLVQIEDADPTVEGHTVLVQVRDEIVARQRSTKDATDSDAARRFGHDVLSALLMKDARRPAADWLDAVTVLAGDPRHRQTERWALWWRPLDPSLVERAVRWMSTADLRAFLEAVAEYGRSQGKSDLTRMLAPRRRFLEGLYETDRIVETRLILGSDVGRRVVGPAGSSSFDAARYSETNGNDKAIIVVDCGDFTVVEGSHNFRLFLFAGEPVHRLMDQRKRHYTLDDFRSLTTAEHEQLHGRGRWTAISHQNGWQREAFSFLRRLGVQVDERSLVDDATYLSIQRRRITGRRY